MTAPHGDAREPAPITAAVREFYESLPFNFHGLLEDAVAAVERDTIDQAYPDVRDLLRSGGIGSVLELGCGAGWLANSIARHHRVRVEAVDLCQKALDRAAEVAAASGHDDRIRFTRADLLVDPLPGPADLVISSGVLHHTADVRAGFGRAAEQVRPGGYLAVGLYHLYGRRPFLEAFRERVEREGEEAAFAHYRALDRIRAADETMARSWFRDQVLHPHETQHTLQEVCGWLDALGFVLTSTSINRFGPVDDRAALFEREREYEEVSRRAVHQERRYFPGFFTVLARAPG